MTRQGKVAVSLGIGVTISIASAFFGVMFEFLDFQRVSATLLWPISAIMPLVPCLPHGDASCEANLFVGRMYLWSIALAVIVYSGLAYLLLSVATRTSNNRFERERDASSTSEREDR
jgi:hypothetical protein